VDSVNADNLLKIKKPEILFSKDNIKAEFRALALKWHPDKCKDPRCSDVFSHISILYNLGLQKIEKDYWNTFGLLEITSIEGKKFNIRYKSMIPFELGVMYVGDTVVAFSVSKSHKLLYKSFLDNIHKLGYTSDKMKAEFSRYLPNIQAEVETTDNLILVLKKTPDVLPLSVVLNYFDGVIDPKGVAWIVSSLHNIHCFLQFNGISHNNIDLNTYFVSPENHSGLLLGGWWYTAGIGKPLKSVPTKTYEYMSVKSRNNKTADIGVDGELIRSLARKLLGDETGITLASKYKVPQDFVSWIRLSGSKKAVDDYKTWRNKVVVSAFGERRFTKMDINITDAYEKFMVSY
jgi:hypothetical protein